MVPTEDGTTRDPAHEEPHRPQGWAGQAKLPGRGHKHGHRLPEAPGGAAGEGPGVCAEPSREAQGSDLLYLLSWLQPRPLYARVFSHPCPGSPHPALFRATDKEDAWSWRHLYLFPPWALQLLSPRLQSPL